MIKFHFLCIFLCSVSSLTFGQGRRISFDHIGPEKGLSQNSVFSLLEDSQGFIWVGTEEGLNRFDGYGFKIYNNDVNDSNSISYSIIWPLYEDHKERLWVGTRGRGLNLLDRKTDKFTRFRHDPNVENSLSNDVVLAIGEDEDGAIWVGTDNGLNKMILENGSASLGFQRYYHQASDSNSLSDSFVEAVYLDQKNDLWIGTLNGLNRYHDGRFIKYFQPKTGDRDPNAINRIYEDELDHLWISTESGLYQFDRKQERFYKIPGVPDITVTCTESDNRGNLWIGTEDEGLYIYDMSNQKVAHFPSDPSEPNSISDNWIKEIMVDRAGIVWIGSYAGSINRYDSEKFKFKHFTHDPKNSNSLNNAILWEIYEDPQKVLWFGTFRGGLNRFDPKSGIFTHYAHDPDDPHSISNNDVRTFFQDSRGRRWIATWGGGLNEMIEDSQGVRFKKYRHDPNNESSLSNDRTWVVFEDKEGFLWIGSNGGIDRFDPLTGIFSNYSHDPQDPHSLSDNSVRAIDQDEQGFLWIGTFNGMNRFDLETKQFKSYYNEPNEENSLSNNFIGSFYLDKSQTIWLGTHSGLTKMSNINSAQPTFVRYSEEDGLPNDVVYGILEDDQGDLWITSNMGLSRFNKKTEEFRNFTETDGLQNNEFNWGAYFKSPDGQLYFGGINGYNVFRPEEIIDNTYLPPIYITQFNLLNQEATIETKNGKGNQLLDYPFPFTKEVTLTHKDYFFSFEFAALNYTHSNSNQYAYKMEGFDLDWIQAGNRRFATYTNLDPGRYIFKVRATNNDGIWSDMQASVSVTILPPWWATWWAYVLYTMIVIGIIWRYLNYRDNVHKGKLNQQEAELRAETAEAKAKTITIEAQAKIEKVKVEEREKLREQNSRDFHDELGHKLTKISMFLELAKRADGVKEDLYKYLRKVEENTKDLSGGMRDFIWVLDPKKDTWYELMIRLKDFGDQLFDHSGISFRMTGLHDDLNNHSVNSDTRRHIVMLFKEAMNNCLKYSECKKALLEVEFKGTSYSISFSDDGQGFNFENTTSGYGLNNMKSRTNRIGGALTIASTPGNGTKITLSSN